MCGVSSLVLGGVGSGRERGIVVGVFAVNEGAVTGSYLSPLLSRHLSPNNHSISPDSQPRLGC